MAVAGVLIPLSAVALYGVLGSPELPGQPLAARTPNSEEGLERSPIGQLLARVEADLAENPNDGRGWEVVAPVYMKLERYDDAARARQLAIRLLGETAARDVDLGEAMTAAANGVISDEAKVAFDRAIKLDAENYAQRSQMIRGMVDRLASRLHENGSDLDGWLRLLRAYKVLGENAKAKEAVAEARAALANEPDKLRRLDAAIKDLDIGG